MINNEKKEVDRLQHAMSMYTLRIVVIATALVLL